MSMNRLTESPQVAEEIGNLIESTGGSRNADLLQKIVATLLDSDHVARGDLKLILRTVQDLSIAMRVFDRYREARKVTVYGSARTPKDSAIYQLARRFAARVADAGLMVLTGAGEGIMQAAQEGAGRERSFGLNIKLPFEQEANNVISNDAKLMDFNYFFTRKLMFVKEAHAFALFPGGFGTHDEAFEALTLMQTGKSQLIPVVFLDVPGSSYWRDWLAFVQRHMVEEKLISPSDMHMFKIIDNVDEAVREITTFYRTYHSARYVDGRLVIRLQRELPETLLARLNREFGDILTEGEIVATGPIGGDASEAPELPRLALWFDRANFGRLRQMIDLINQG